MPTKGSGGRETYPCSPFAAALITGGYGDYDTVINGTFENLVMTWSCVAVSSYERAKINKERNGGAFRRNIY